jgi:GR25 family glycosyltransferase involved in LPS biosynthesis
MNNFFDIYIIHNYKLAERKKYIKNMLANYEGINFVEIEKCAPDFPFALYKGLKVKDWIKKCKNLWNPVPTPRELTKGEVAATASHFYAYKHFLSNSQKEWILVLEDDAVFECRIIQDIYNMIKDAPPRLDALFIGGGYPHDVVALTVGIYKNFIIKYHPATNTAVGYMLRKKILMSMLEDFDSFDLPIDYELAYLLMINNALVFHSEPYLIKEGSKSVYKSSLR